MIRFEIAGHPVDPNDIANSIKAKALQVISERLRERVGSIRHPETGEFPVILVKGSSLDNLSIEVSGSPELVKIVQERLNEDDLMEEDKSVIVESQASQKVAFLCHASEDNEFVRKLAGDLRKHGVEVFFDEWEIRPGDSIREKIDHGLGNCTHFIAILTPSSINKPWVKVEIDAGFMQRVERSITFIPLRVGLGLDSLPPLLHAISSPSFDNYDSSLPELVSAIYCLTKKPPLGPPPSIIANRTVGMGISPAAEAIIKLIMEKTENGVSMDPQLSPDDIRQGTGLIDDDIVDAIDELEGQGYIRSFPENGSDDIGFMMVTPEAELFVKYDKHFTSWDPEADAIRIAVDMLNRNDDFIEVEKLAKAYEWEPRRMNPAISFLAKRNLVIAPNLMGCPPWEYPMIKRTHETRRFVRSRS